MNQSVVFELFAPAVWVLSPSYKRMKLAKFLRKYKYKHREALFVFAQMIHRITPVPVSEQISPVQDEPEEKNRKINPLLLVATGESDENVAPTSF